MCMKSGPRLHQDYVIAVIVVAAVKLSYAERQRTAVG
jgi:hypothetical protein